MTHDELAALQQRYATPGEGYGHFKLALLDKINDHFAPYKDKREYYLNHKDEVRDILAHGAKKAKKVAQAKMEIIRQAVGLAY
jgi:tryptophanyl-tRNA synthetase